jgi:CRISPR-associated protein Cas5d
MKQGGSYQLLATVLVNVCYRLYAEVRSASPDAARPTKRAKAWMNSTTNPAHAYQEIFERRLRRGQCHAVPCLGWREFVPDYVGEFRKGTQVYEKISTEMPSMLHTVFRSDGSGRFEPIFRQNVEIREGVLTYAE